MTGTREIKEPFIAQPGELVTFSTHVDLETIAGEVKRIIGVYDRVLEKCGHCGQWGAVMCSCPQCGAPIDPK